MIYCGIGYELITDCENQLARCVIYASSHEIKEYQYRIIHCQKKIRKIYIYIIVLYINYNKNHISNSSQCISKWKVILKAQKEKMLEQSNKKKQKKIRSEVWKEKRQKRKKSRA